MDSFKKDMRFDCIPLRDLVAKTTMATLYYLFNLIYNVYSSL